MADGLGFKTFTTGEVLTAGDTNGYLMQGILVFATEAARDAAITAPAEGQFAFTKDTNSTWYYDGAAWVASGASGDVTGITVSNGIAGTSLSGPVPALTLATTAKGDLLAGTGSNTAQALTVGANDTVLTADSTTATGLKWATSAAAASGLTLVTRTVFSSQSTLIVDNVFTSTYTSYLVIIEDWQGTSTDDDPQIQLRYGSTTEASGYYGTSYGLKYQSATLTTQLNDNTSQITLWPSLGAGAGTFVAFNIERVGGGSQTALIVGQGTAGSLAEFYSFGSLASIARAYTGLLLKTSSGNSSAIVSVFGLAKA